MEQNSIDFNDRQLENMMRGTPSAWHLLRKSTHYYQTWCSLQIIKQVCEKAPSYVKAR